MCRPGERGVALVAAVGALAMLSVLAASLAYTSIVDQHLTRNALSALQADALARSGVAVAAVLLRETRTADAPDTLRSPWAAPSGRQPLGAGWVEVRIEDEARRLDLNASEMVDAVPRLLQTLGLDPRLADTIADWTDADSVPRPAGAERDWYLGLSPPYLPADGPLRSVGELGLMRGIDARVLARLRPFVTVAGEHGVNPNTAPREVLLAVVQDTPAVERVLAARGRAPIAPADLPALLPELPAARARLTPRAQHYTVRALAGVGETRRALEATLWAPAGAEPAVVAWRGVVPEP